MLQTIANNTNSKADFEQVEDSDQQQPWKPITQADIKAFIGVLLYIGLAFMSRIENYWNTNSDKAMHILIIKSISCNK